VCSCFDGHSGDDCSACARGFTRANGHCVVASRAATPPPACPSPPCGAAALAAAAEAQAKAEAAARRQQFRREKGAVIGATVGSLVLMASLAAVTHKYHSKWQLELFRKLVKELSGQAAE
jgi:hypothetical protein